MQLRLLDLLRPPDAKEMVKPCELLEELPDDVRVAEFGSPGQVSGQADDKRPHVSVHRQLGDGRFGQCSVGTGSSSSRRPLRC